MFQETAQWRPSPSRATSVALKDISPATALTPRAPVAEVEVSLPALLVAEATPARSATAAARRGISRVRALKLVAPQVATPPATATVVLSAAVRSVVEAVAEGRRATRVAASAI